MKWNTRILNLSMLDAEVRLSEDERECVRVLCPVSFVHKGGYQMFIWHCRCGLEWKSKCVYTKRGVSHRRARSWETRSQREGVSAPKSNNKVYVTGASQFEIISRGGAPREVQQHDYRWPQHLAFSINHRPPSVGNFSVSRTWYPRWGATLDLIHLFQKNMSLCGGSSARERPLTSWITSRCDYVYV